VVLDFVPWGGGGGKQRYLAAPDFRDPAKWRYRGDYCAPSSSPVIAAGDSLLSLYDTPSDMTNLLSGSCRRILDEARIHKCKQIQAEFKCSEN
jgi:hypothetical protein